MLYLHVNFFVLFTYPGGQEGDLVGMEARKTAWEDGQITYESCHNPVGR
jgi:hypothetical protein